MGSDGLRAVDFQTQMTTKMGALFPGMKEFFEKQFKTTIPYFQTEEEMVGIYRKARIKACIVPPTSDKSNFEKITEINNYTADLRDKHPDCIAGFWVMLNPLKNTEKWLAELERCLRDLKSYGIFYYGATTGVPCTDERLKPFWQLCSRYKAPVKVSVGHTAAGQGLPGGGGLRLRSEMPIPHVDDLAADFPSMTIIAAHNPWPWHEQMCSVLMHKGNVYNELHGWSPKLFPPELKRQLKVNGRVRSKFLFGSDWPFIPFERLFGDWEAEEYGLEILNQIFVENAKKALKLA